MLNISPYVCVYTLSLGSINHYWPASPKKEFLYTGFIRIRYLHSKSTINRPPMRLICLLFISFLSIYSVFAQVIVSPQRQNTQFNVRAVDQKTGLDIPANFDIYLHIADKKFSGKNVLNKPNFYIEILRSDTVTVVTSSDGFHTLEEILLVSCDTCGLYQHTVLMEKDIDSVFTDLKTNDIIKLDKVYFDQSKYDLRPESRDQLQKLYRTLRDNPKLRIEISGHTDNVGDSRLNQYLSENRAQVIYNYLVRMNIAGERLQHRGYGQTQPVAPNDTEENKTLNRRVEFLVLDN